MVNTISWEEWERRQRQKYTFEGKMLPPPMVKQLSFHGFTPGETCEHCSRYCLVKVMRKQHGQVVSVDELHCVECTAEGMHWNGNWPACGLFSPKSAEAVISQDSV